MKLKNHDGKGVGLALIGILIVALLVAWLTLTQFSFLGIGGSETGPDVQQEQQDQAQEAQDAVDQINQRIQQDGTDSEDGE